MDVSPLVRRLGLAAPVLAVLGACSALLVGFPAPPGLGGHDADIAIAWLGQVTAALADGDPWPRWLPQAAFGFGSPAFYIYPPLLYWVGGLVGLATGLGPDLALRLTLALVALAGGGAMLLLLRREGCPDRAARTLAALYLVFPYAAFIDPIHRGAAAECAALAALPVVGLALRLPPARPAAIAGLGAAFALLILTHLPMAVLMAGLGVVHYLLRWRGWRALAVFAAGQALAAALGAPVLVPALSLQGLISPEYWTLWPGWRPSTWLLFQDPTHLRPGGHLLYYACFALLLLLAGQVIALRRWARAGWGGADLPPLLAGLLALALTTPLTKPAWDYLPILPLVQIPLRAFGPASLFLVLALGRRLAAGAARPGRVLLLGLLPSAAMTAALLLAVTLLPERGPRGGYRFLPSEARAAAAMASPGGHPPEYIPRWAHAADWAEIGVRQVAPPAAVQGLPAVVQGEGRVAERRTGATYRLEIDCATACRVLARQFWWPAFVLEGLPGAPTLDPATGMAAVEAPAGRHLVAFRRRWLPSEWIGLGAFAAGLAVLAVLAWPRRAIAPVAGGAGLRTRIPAP
ncbi:hypothetical protein [Paracraurococcus lichenis]|uniref:Membrane protein 6-pyruvoyl-tetrahydropterin synthase-related domain-containing protein n=1 Tax=Paracraurococcus lichenis TaxID=3064888 RepID=A0ABT9E5Z6_9PROT|nr:hypothetical protein [Paracraurococcus sp. LOR1-02]MDO9711556.1 hypothetical protein [Paracraurococcus sp. LOR1-02]